MGKSVVEYSIEKYRKLANKFGYKFHSKCYCDPRYVAIEDPFSDEVYTEDLNAELTIFLSENNHGKKTLKKYKKAEYKLLDKIYKKFGCNVCICSWIINPQENILDEPDFKNCYDE